MRRAGDAHCVEVACAHARTCMHGPPHGEGGVHDRARTHTERVGGARTDEALAVAATVHHEPGWVRQQHRLVVAKVCVRVCVCK